MIIINEGITTALSIVGIFSVVGTACVVVVFAIATGGPHRTPGKERPRPEAPGLARLYDAGYAYIMSQHEAGADVALIAMNLNERGETCFDDGAWKAVDVIRESREQAFLEYDFRRSSGLSPEEAIIGVPLPEGIPSATIAQEFEARFQHYNPGFQHD